MHGADIDWERIRPYGRPASRSNAFEELSSTLIRHGAVEWPGRYAVPAVRHPDGGWEGRGVLPDGEVWAWQAKYLFVFDASAAGQVDSSVRQVLESEVADAGDRRGGAGSSRAGTAYSDGAPGEPLHGILTSADAMIEWQPVEAVHDLVRGGHPPKCW